VPEVLLECACRCAEERAEKESTDSEPHEPRIRGLKERAAAVIDIATAVIASFSHATRAHIA